MSTKSLVKSKLIVRIFVIIHTRNFRKKRQIAEVRIMQEQAEMALLRHMPRGCQEVACGIFDPFTR